jgi:3D (Asp-Asp-Asp) domain-containing protein
MKKQLVSSGIILALLGSNLVIGYQYISDSKKYEQKISQKSKIISQNKEKLIVLTEKSVKNEQKLSDFSNKIDLLTVELEKVKKENKDLTKENNQIKKVLADREEVKQVFDVTAYTAGYESTQKRKGDKGYGLTASGTYVKEGRTIACPPSMEFGTKVKIEGVGLRTCEDRGSAVKTGHLDLYMDSVNEALDFGRQKLLVEVVEEGNV